MDTGKFILNNDSFIAGNKKYLFKKRKKQKEKKPEDFLITLEPFSYVSSLFPLAGEENTFTMDIDKKVYILKKAPGAVEIAEME